MRPQRPCLGLPGFPCGVLTRNPHGRCRPCQQAHDKAKNRGAGYRRTRVWQDISRAAREVSPVCAICGGLEDLTVDHITPRSLEQGVQVLCRSCNGRKGNRQ